MSTATQARAKGLFLKDKYKPPVKRRLQAVFAKVEETNFLPVFMHGRTEAKDGMEYFVCTGP